MASEQTRLYMLCGKIASGKSTLAGMLASTRKAVIISEDHWLSNLYPEEIKTPKDYVTYSNRLKNVLGHHVQSLLEHGLSVVLDFPANTVEFRSWMKQIVDRADVDHELHYLDVSDEECKERLARRNQEGNHAFQPSNEEYDIISRYFVPPDQSEGFNIIYHRD